MSLLFLRNVSTLDTESTCATPEVLRVSKIWLQIIGSAARVRVILLLLAPVGRADADADADVAS